MIDVSVVYALPDQQVIMELSVEDGCTVKQAVEQSGLLAQFTEIDIQTMQVGIYSERVSLEHLLRAGDRVEVYRPLTIDPKEARRNRAKIAKK